MVLAGRPDSKRIAAFPSYKTGSHLARKNENTEVEIHRFSWKGPHRSFSSTSKVSGGGVYKVSFRPLFRDYKRGPFLSPLDRNFKQAGSIYMPFFNKKFTRGSYYLYE